MAFTKIVPAGINTGGSYTLQDLNVVGVLTASSFSGPLTGDATGLTGTPDVTVGAITAASADFTGNVSIGGTLTYEDVTNVDSIGIITAQSGIHVTGGSVGIGTDNPQSFLSLRQDGGGFEVNANSGSNNARLLSYDRVASSYREMTFQALSYGFETSGSEKLRITSGGNVGIGTNTPNLQSTSANNLVIADFGGEGGITIKTNINSAGNIFFADTAATANGRIAYGHGTLDAGDYMRFYVANDEKLRINANGNIGIGTNAPESKLHLHSPNNDLTKIRLSGTAANQVEYDIRQGIVGVENGGISIRDITNSITRFAITSTGNIGIGTDNPGAKLEVRDGSSQGIIVRSNSTQATDTNKALRVRNNSDTNTFHVSHKGQGFFAGSVGIGTDNPTERVHLDLGTFGSNSQSDFHGYLLSGDCTGNQGYIGYRTYLENSSADFGAYVRATRYAGSTFVGMEIGTDTNNRPIRFLTGGTTDTYERMRIQETGIVFIGDATPAASENGQLNVYTTTSGGLSQFVHSAGNGGLRLGGTGNGSAAHLVFSNDYNSGTWSDEYTIRMDGSDDSLRFLSGGVSGTERVRMRSDGNVVHLVSCISSADGGDINSFYNNKEGCGMFTQGAYSSCGAHIEVGADATDGWANVYLNRYWTSGEDERMIDFRISNTTKGTITTNTSGTTYNTTSDIRLKTDINPISDATDKLMNMNPVTHKWKEDPDGDTVHGFIAQEMQNIAPEAVHGEPDGEMMMGMDYGRITPIIVAALQNAIEEINTLKKRITELEN